MMLCGIHKAVFTFSEKLVQKPVLLREGKVLDAAIAGYVVLVDAVTICLKNSKLSSVVTIGYVI